MDAAQTIRDAIADVTAQRLHRTGDPALGRLWAASKACRRGAFGAPTRT
ncbi:hypothetical protein CLU85_4083 [Acidovorax sp. 69]|nr:hypothetical protein [Acidovorax sp. 69]PJI99241.1 hypothetical protein CLU85_4083 [Acidovorax sp. 69]